MKVLPEQRGHASLSPSLAFIDVVLTRDPAMILLPSMESRFGIELDLDLARGLDVALDLSFAHRLRLHTIFRFLRA